MPQPSARSSNGRKNKQRKSQPETPSSQRISPPTHLPTPLPDETLSLPHHQLVSEPPHLIDFDTPTPPHPFVSLPTEHSLDMEDSVLDEEAGLESTYRSPPFREAYLPRESPPPLPVPPRVGSEEPEVLEQSSLEESVSGEVIAPTFSRLSTSSRSPTTVSPTAISPSRSYSHSSTPGYGPGLTSSTTFENFTHTIRRYVPSSINIPIGISGPSPPLLSRPDTFGRFSGLNSPTSQHGHRRAATQQEYERDYEQTDGNGEYYGAYGYARSQPQPPAQQRYHQPQPTQPPVDVSALTDGHVRASSTSSTGSGVAQAMRKGGSTHHPQQIRTSKSQEQEKPEAITWARWDVLGERRVLLISYPSRVQMWDCSDLSSLSEVLNLNFNTDEWAMALNFPSARVRAVHAAILPAPSGKALQASGGKDKFKDSRPLVAFLLESSDEDDNDDNDHGQRPRSAFVLYSLRRHELVKRLGMPGAGATFIPNEHFIVISTTTPTNLHILSSTTFDTLHTISSSSLAPFAPAPVYQYPSVISAASSFSPSSVTSPALSITNAMSPTTSSSKPVSLPGLSIDGRARDGRGETDRGGGTSPIKAQAVRPPVSRPVFALSGRLLAYASASASSLSSGGHSSSVGVSPSIKASRRLSSSSSTSGPSAHSSSVSSSPFGGLGRITGLTSMNITQADVGHAALKVGEGVLSGMKFLGGMALEAAKSRVSVGGSSTSGSPSTSAGQPGSVGAGSRFVSRSAPDHHISVDEEAAQRMRERRYSSNANVSTISSLSPPGAGQSSTTVAPYTRPLTESGYYVTVVDLAALFACTSSSGKDKAGKENPRKVQPTKIDEFIASKSQPVASIFFAEDGTGVGVALRDGHSVKIFKLRPVPSMYLSASRGGPVSVGATTPTNEYGDDATGPAEPVPGSPAVQIYDLRRGRTAASIESVAYAKDGRWAAIGTNHRTIHVFATNPYGGPSDVRSHLEGRVRNVDFVDPNLTTLAPILRLRLSRRSSQPDRVKAPLAFAFIGTSELSLSPQLLPPPMSPTPITHSPSMSPSARGKRPSNYQHVLVFDPEDGVLSLRRIIVDKQPVRDQSLASNVVAGVQALGVSSMSLPGMGGAGKLSAPSPSTSPSTTRLPPSTAVVEPPMEITATEGGPTFWDLSKGKDLREVRQSLSDLQDGLRRQHSTGGDWLSEAELSTCSNLQSVLPRSLYLSHQFSFHALGEDYHAAIRSHQYGTRGPKINVRKEVEISAYSSGSDSTGFMEGFTAPRDIRRAASSFDEPIASAISISFDNSNIPAILPMYPNGVPGSKPKSFRNSIPIRTMAGIGDGVSEGIGRIRREMHRVRSPQLVARSDSSMSGPVPLEFDEEDEDFLVRDTLAIPASSHSHAGREDSSTSRGTSRDGASISAGSAGSSLVTPASSSTQQLLDADVVGTVDEEMFYGWDGQDKLAVEEAEQFDDLGSAAYLVEEQERRRQHVMVPETPVTKKKRRR